MTEPEIKTLTKAPELAGGSLRLTHLSSDRVSNRYVDWINDPEVVRFTESRFGRHTEESLKAFVRSVETDSLSVMWAMLIEHEHIGNIKLGPIDWHHALGDIGLIVGSKEHWGRGLATTAISLVSDWAFSYLSLHKISAGICDGNIGSVRAFEKAGFSIEARQSSHYFLDGEYRDRLIMARINPQTVRPPGQS